MLGQMTIDMTHACHECGERGRIKELLNVKGQLKLLCHDEEKSCYYYVLRSL